MDTVFNWLVDSTFYISLFVSVLIVLAGFGAYIVFYRFIHRERGVDKAETAYSRLVGFGVTLLVLLLLLRIWKGQVAFIDQLLEWLSTNRVYGNILWTVIALVAVYLFSRAVEPALLSGAEDITARHKVRSAIYWVRAIAIIVVLLMIWAGSARDLGVFLGIVGAGLALSLQETVLCIAGWALIIVKKPFDLGDRVEIDGHIGDVVDIRVFQSSLLEVGNWVHADQSTGRIVNVPNSAVFRKPTFNYTRGFPFIWNEIEIIVTFESDWRTAKDILLLLAEKEANKIEKEVANHIAGMQGDYAVRYQNLTPIVYTSLAEQGIALTLRYLAPVRKRRGTAHEIYEGVLDAFEKKDNIDFAYPTMRIFKNTVEGKPGTVNINDPAKLKS